MFKQTNLLILIDEKKIAKYLMVFCEKCAHEKKTRVIVAGFLQESKCETQCTCHLDKQPVLILLVVKLDQKQREIVR